VTRVGVFGGQFDPPHNGHLRVLRAARDQLGLDVVLVVPAGRPPHRPPPRTDAETRYALAVTAFAAEPGVEVSRVELDRPGPSYTVDTLEQLAGPGRELFLILGADQLAALSSWHRHDRIRALATLAVASRPGAPVAGGAVGLAMEPVDVSSSAVRCRVAKGDDIGALVPAGVAEAIARGRLYAGAAC
jgi:nicotinate-nucleotide adenylyltransferase